MPNNEDWLVRVVNSRGGEVVIKAIGKLVVFGMALYLIWHEFPELKTSPEFLVLLMTVALYAFITFTLDYRDAKKKPLDEIMNEKFDELITEMRGLREDVRINGCKYPNSKV